MYAGLQYNLPQLSNRELKKFLCSCLNAEIGHVCICLNLQILPFSLLKHHSWYIKNTYWVSFDMVCLRSDSTCVLKAEPGKLDSKRHKPGVLFISVHIDSFLKMTFITLLLIFPVDSTPSKAFKNGLIKKTCSEIDIFCQVSVQQSS